MLVGSQSFWEGIDVPGDALQCVLIDKLPFPPPNDPLIEARVKHLEAQGRNPFNECFVADAAVSLKQGAGRLIRSETDRGLLVVCDPRMARLRYGRRLRAALPPMPLARRVTTRWSGCVGLARRALKRCPYQSCHHGPRTLEQPSAGSGCSGSSCFSTRSASSRSCSSPSRS